MEEQELRYIGSYAKRLNDGGGDLTKLTKDERAHLRTLMRKYDLERKLDEMAEKVGQGKLL